MRLEEDDLYDYDDESFDEEGAIAEVVTSLKALNVSETDAETELDKVDWDIDLAVANLRKRLAKPKAQEQRKVAGSTVKDQTKGKLTPLQMLAQRRSQAGQASVESDENTSKSPADYTDSCPRDVARGQLPKMSLAQIAAQRRQRSEPSEAAGETRTSNALSKLRARPKGRREAEGESSGETRLEKVERVPPEGELASKGASSRSKWQPLISFALPASVSLAQPSLYGSLIGISQRNSRQFDRDTNSLEAANKAFGEFSKPSPDDRVLNAQSEAFGASAESAKKKPAQPNSFASKSTMGRGPSANIKGASSAVASLVERSAEKAKDALSAARDTEKASVPHSVAGTPAAVPASRAKQSTTSAASKEGPNGLRAKLEKIALRPHCSFVVIGHVDAGKSTLMGRLLLDTGALNAKTVQRFEHESSKIGKPSFWLAWAMDATTEERERGVTVDIGEANFSTEKTDFTVLDAPGHRDYVPNMIAGVAQADLAVLVVDSDTNAFESGFSLDGQTKEHAVLTRSLGVDRLIVAVNKMDTQAWSESRYIDICAQLTEFLTKRVGYTPEKIVYVPTSGISGVNVVRSCAAANVQFPKELLWYKGPSLVDALEGLAQSPVDGTRVNQPLRFAVANAYSEPFQSTVTVSGRVLTGSVEADDNLELLNSHELVRVRSITDREFLVAGDQGELRLSFDRETVAKGVSPGDIIVGQDAGLALTQSFIAKVRFFDLPKPVLPGTPLAFHLGRVEDTVKVTSILNSLDPKQKNKKLRHLSKGSAARVVLQLTKPTVLATPAVCKELGRFVMRLNGTTVGGGIVEEIC